MFTRTMAMLLTALVMALAPAPAPHAPRSPLAAGGTANPADSAWGGGYIPPGPK